MPESAPLDLFAPIQRRRALVQKLLGQAAQGAGARGARFTTQLPGMRGARGIGQGTHVRSSSDYGQAPLPQITIPHRLPNGMNAPGGYHMMGNDNFTEFPGGTPGVPQGPPDIGGGAPAGGEASYAPAPSPMEDPGTVGTGGVARPLFETGPEGVSDTGGIAPGYTPAVPYQAPPDPWDLFRRMRYGGMQMDV